jgi:hypothetical protein
MAPAPVAYDSLSYYFNLAKELGTTGRYVTGQYAMPIELIFGSGFAVMRSLGLGELAELVTMHWAWWGGLAAWLSIFTVGKVIGHPKAGVLAATVYYTMPIIGFYMSSEPKTETFIVYLFSLVLLLFLHWIDKPSHGKVFLLCVGLWYAFTIKITSGFGMAAMAATVLLVILLRRRWYRYIPSFVVSLVLAMVLVASPWFVLHAWERGLTVGELVVRIKNKDIHGTILVGQNQIIRQRQQAFTRLPNFTGASSGYGEDYDRYVYKDSSLFGLENVIPVLSKNEALIQKVKIPWNVTTVQILPTLHFLISPFYLGSCIVVLLYLYKLISKKYKEANRSAILYIAVFAIVYVAVWWEMGKSVVWYGIGMFVPLGIISSLAWIEVYKKNRIFKSVANMVVILVVAMGVYIQLSRLGDPSVLGFTSRQADKSMKQCGS